MAISISEYREQLQNTINALMKIRLCVAGRTNDVNEPSPNASLVTQVNLAIDAVSQELYETYKANGIHNLANGWAHPLEYDYARTVDIMKDGVKIGEKSILIPVNYTSRVNLQICARCKHAAASDIRNGECICQRDGLTIVLKTDVKPCFEAIE